MRRNCYVFLPVTLWRAPPRAREIARAIATTADGVKIVGTLENVKFEYVKVGMKLKTGTKILEDGYVTITLKKCGH